jgi:putative ABC transport system permease protein
VIGLSGRFRSALIIGGQGIRARKTRTLLSMVSLFMGVLAVVTVQTGSAFAQKELLKDAELQMAKDGTLQMYLPGDKKTGPIALDALKGRVDAVGVINMQATIGEPNVTAVNPGGQPFDHLDRGGGMVVKCGPNGCSSAASTKPSGAAIDVQLVGLTGDIRQFRPFRPQSGDWLDFTGAPRLSPQLVLNKEAAKGFSRYQVPAQLHVDGATADATPQIVGVVDDGNSYQPTAYVRADELLNWLPIAETTSESYGPSMQVLLDPTATDLEQTLRARLTAAGVDSNQLYSQVTKTKERAQSQLRLMELIFLAMAALVLLIGTAGILNVGLATVGERVEEFALRRAVGTPRVLLAGIVLAETLLTGLMTSGLAILTGVLGLKAAGIVLRGRFPSLAELDFPWQAGVAGVIAGLVAGLLGGLIPAIRAARIPIATVMRA